MSYKVYSGEFLTKHGFPVIIVTSPIVTGEKHITECHTFFSGDQKSYALSTSEYDSEDKELIDDAMLVETVKKIGEEIIFQYLSKVNSSQYQAMLAGHGYKILETEEKFLLHLHLRNFLSHEIEKQISNNTNDRELKQYLRQLAGIGRITTMKKI